MKKILFLQIMGDSLGGITNVNQMLSKEFLERNFDVYIYSLRNGGYYKKVEYDARVNVKILNEKDEWGLIKGKDIKLEIKKCHFFKACYMLLKRIAYKIKLKKDFKLMKDNIINLKPDVIINSHYELLDAIPLQYLKKTIMHFHTSFGQVTNNHSCIKIFNKYKDKIKKFVWLTNETCNNARNYGYLNSIFIYNPARIESNAEIIYNNKIVFVGRFSKEKRIDLLIKIFLKNQELYKDSCELHLYGDGDIEPDTLNIINENPNIIIHPFQDNVNDIFENASINLNTSLFEGLSMTVIEAAVCGVPTIIFNFGESVKEQVLDGKTGFIIKMDDIDEYAKKIHEILTNIELRKQMYDNCKKFSRCFDKNDVINKWLQLFGDNYEE